MFTKRLFIASWLLTILGLWAPPGLAQSDIRVDEQIRINVFSTATRACLNRMSPRRRPTLEHIVKTRKTIWILDFHCKEKQLDEINRFLEMQYNLSLFMTDPEVREYKYELARLNRLPPLRGADLDSWVERTELSFSAIVFMEQPYAVHKVKEIYRLTHENLAAMPTAIANEIYRVADKFRIRIFSTDRERAAFFDGKLDANRRPLTDLGLPPRCLRILHRAEFWNVDELDEASRTGKFAAMPGFGRVCREHLAEALARHGWTLPKPNTQHIDELKLDRATRAALIKAHLYDVPSIREYYLDGHFFDSPEIGARGLRAIDKALGIDLPRILYAEKIMLVRRGIRTMEALKTLSVSEAVALGIYPEVSQAYRLQFGRDLYFDPLDRDIAEGHLDHLLKVTPTMQIHLNWAFGIRTVGELLAAMRRNDSSLNKVIDQYEPDLRARIENRVADCTLGLLHVKGERK